MSEAKYDVVVCGAGVVGLATALSLARQQLKIAVLAPESKPQHNLGEQYHSRIYTLSGRTQAFLQQLGVWQSLPQDRITPVEAMQVRGDQGGQVVLDAWQAVMSELAYTIESGELEFALLNALRIFGVDFIHDSFVQFNGTQVTTEAGCNISCELLVGADGGQSRVRQACSIESNSRPYDDIGLVVQLGVEKPHNHKAYQWFIDHGVIAFLPLPDTRSGHQVSLVWSLPKAQAQQWLAKSSEAIEEELPAALGALTQYALGDLSVNSRLLGFPLTLNKTAMIGNRVALVGDAAHSIHPLAGQGLNLGLNDVEVLSQVIKQREHFRKIGDYRVLSRYKLRRSEDLFKMRLVTDGLYKLFNQTFPGSGIIRNLGMSIFDKSPWIKRSLVQAASGKLGVDDDMSTPSK